MKVDKCPPLMTLLSALDAYWKEYSIMIYLVYDTYWTLW